MVKIEVPNAEESSDAPNHNCYKSNILVENRDDSAESESLPKPR